MSLERGEGRFLASPSGASLYVETYGPADGLPIVLTHGWSLDSTVWFYAKRDLARQFRLVLWDLPGLGRSKRPPDGHIDMGKLAQDLETVLGAAGGRPAVLVGHSIGGMIIQ